MDAIWNLTKACPWNCAICCVSAVYVNGDNKNVVKESQKRAGEELSFEGKMKVLEILAERNFRIDFSGGDPLYYDDDFEIVRRAVTLLPPQNISVSMTGSGYINHERVEILKSIDAIELTLDNVFEYRNPFRPRGYNASSAIMLKKCTDVGINVRAVTTLHQYSIFRQNLEEIYGWLCNNGVREWSVIKFCPVGRAMKFAQSMPSDHDYLEAVNVLRKFNGYTKIVFQHSLEVLEGNKKCHAAIDSIGILPDGKVVACAWALHDKCIPFKEFELGKLPEDNLDDILKNARENGYGNRAESCRIISQIKRYGEQHVN